jgi:hypothetical protein
VGGETTLESECIFSRVSILSHPSSPGPVKVVSIDFGSRLSHIGLFLKLSNTPPPLVESRAFCPGSGVLRALDMLGARVQCNVRMGSFTVFRVCVFW